MKGEEITKVKDFEKQLNGIINDFYPFSNLENNKLEVYSERELEEVLNSYYLYEIEDLFILDDEEKFNIIENRFMSILNAAYNADIKLAFILTSNNNKISFRIGVNDEKYTDKSPIIDTINGVLPGSKINYNKNLLISDLIKSCNFSGAISSIPTLKIDDEKQVIDFSNVTRALENENYTIILMANPIKYETISEIYNNISKLNDKVHTLTKYNMNYEESIGKSFSNSNTIGHSIGGNLGLNFGIGNIINTGLSICSPLGGVFAGVGRVLNTGNAIGVSVSKSKSETVTEGEDTRSGQGLSIEVQNSIALYLECEINRLLERLRVGFNTGLWETMIGFSTVNEHSRDVLIGSILGELNKPRSEGESPIIIKSQENENFIMPKYKKEKALYNKTLSLITNNELANIVPVPKFNVPGFEIKKQLNLSLNIPNNGEKYIGKVCELKRGIKNIKLGIDEKDILKHTFVCGLTGSGKTNTVKNIINSLNKPFLVIESAKKEYRNMLTDDLNIYTIGSNVSPLRFNPFYIMKGVSLGTHIDNLKSIFNASFSLYGPMPHIIEKCLYRVYEKYGWDLTLGRHYAMYDEFGDEIIDEFYKSKEHKYFFPTINSLKSEVEDYIENNMGYQGEVGDNIKTAILTRLESLSVGSKGTIFNTIEPLNIKGILKSQSILELDELADDDDKAFFIGLILTYVSEFRILERNSLNFKNNLNHILILEEAHRLLKNISAENNNEMIGNSKGKAVEYFCNMIAEMRALGQGVIIAEQIPTKLASDVIKNTSNKIVHRIVGSDDLKVLQSSLGLSDDEIDYLATLETGYALYSKEGMRKATEVKINLFENEVYITDEKVKYHMNLKHSSNVDSIFLNMLNNSINIDDLIIRFINSLLVEENINFIKLIDLTIKEVKKSLGFRLSKIIKDDEIINKFIINKTLEILLSTQGMYSIVDNKSFGIIDVLEEIVLNKNKQYHERFKYLFKESKGIEDVSRYISEIISNLIRNRILISENTLKFSRKLINEYFIINNDSMRDRIVSIYNEME
ncbi:ATP-binding protein [Clostridium perfringens]